jgi:hypothetical protein
MQAIEAHVCTPARYEAKILLDESKLKIGSMGVFILMSQMEILFLSCVL